MIPNLRLMLFSIFFTLRVLGAVASAKGPSCGTVLEDDIQTYEANYLKKTDANGLTILDKVSDELPSDPLLTKAELVAIKWYTLSYQMEPRILNVAALKLPLKSGIFYRGQKSSNMKIKKVGQFVTLDRIYSISGSREVAEGFVNPQDKSEILKINAKTARDISKYSQVHPEGLDEQEHFLLPGVQLKVESISETTVMIQDEETGELKFINVRFIEVIEI